MSVPRTQIIELPVVLTHCERTQLADALLESLQTTPLADIEYAFDVEIQNTFPPSNKTFQNTLVPKTIRRIP
ncbi:MAG: hypothetical protein PHU06_11525 [Gallionella sp.]|nr:hypothetical protein [Gallionella sp.]MDD4959923.1 hypothetical protein [Gallionella sp.]